PTVARGQFYTILQVFTQPKGRCCPTNPGGPKSVFPAEPAAFPPLRPPTSLPHRMSASTAEIAAPIPPVPSAAELQQQSERSGLGYALAALGFWGFVFPLMMLALNATEGVNAA